jgi:hypothetical protein
MSYPELNRGDRGDAVKQLQSWLNRVGAMLIPDGDFGRGTERAVRYAQDVANQTNTGTADPILWSWLETQADPFPPLATDGVAFIAKEETGGLSYFEAVTRWPHFPGAASGITIGVGYDLRFHTEPNFRQLWEPHLSPDVLDELAQDIGKPGTKKRADELKKMGIEVPFKAAWPVFTQDILPRYYRETLKIYPSMERLPELCRSVLVSLVFNRGAALKGSRRTEMRKIRDILQQADDFNLNKPIRKSLLQEVENQLVSMQRLWPPSSGLIKRRQAEANLWRQGLRSW